MIETIYTDFKSLLCMAILFGVAYFCFGIAIRFGNFDQPHDDTTDLTKRD